MARHVYFRDDHYTSFAGIGNYLSYLIVSVETAFVSAFALVLRIIELRICAAFDSPSWIIGEVPMEYVDLVECKEVKFLL
jgi:hypothetical protein